MDRIRGGDHIASCKRSPTHRHDSALRQGPALGDPFGAALLAQETAGDVAVHFVIERDDGLINLESAREYLNGPDRWSSLDLWATEMVRGRVLDIGCGAGRHALHLQEKGLHVVGIDTSPLAAQVSRMRGCLNVETGTAYDVLRRGGGPFDTFLLLGHNLGLLQSQEGSFGFLCLLARLASPGAIILGHSTDPHASADALMAEYRDRNVQLGRLPGQWGTRLRYQNTATDWFDYLFLGLEELQKLVEGTGWCFEQAEVAGASYVAVLRRVKGPGS